MTHPAAGWSFRHRRTVLTGRPPPYPPAQAGQINASRTAAFASLAPAAAAQDAPREPPADDDLIRTGPRTAKAAVTPCFPAPPTSRDDQEIQDARLAAHATWPATHGITRDSGQPGTHDQQAHRREPPQWPPAPHRCLARPGSRSSDSS